MNTKKPSLIQISTDDGLYLHGFFSPNNNKKIALLHIHGFEGNFYENNFVHVLAKELEKNNISFLTVNTRGNGRETEFNTTSGEIVKIGAHYELLEDAHLDISAWVKFLLDSGYEEIILQGHSLGTIKVVRYIFEGKYKDNISKLILLAPFDNKALVESTGLSINELLKKAEEKCKKGKSEENIPNSFNHPPMSYQTFISWNKQNYLGRMFDFCSSEYDFPILKKIKIPTKVIVGSKDEYFHLSNPEHPEEAMEILLKNLSNGEGKIIESAVHSFHPHEDDMATEVVSFILG